MKKSRDQYFQLIRGICICAVILIHCQAQGHSIIAEYYQIILRQMINFAVATFIFMAGFFAHPYKIRENGYWNRLKKLLIPYIVWSIFFSVLNENFNLLRIIYNLITGRAQTQLYYIIVLLELTLITPLLIKSLDNKKVSVAIILITPTYLLLTNGFRYFTGADISWIGRDCLAWIIFYYLGMLVKRNGWKQKNTYYLCFLYIIALIFSVAEGLFANVLKMFSLAISQVKISSMFYSLTVIALIMNQWVNFKKKNINKSSRNPYKIANLSKVKQKIIYLLIHIGDISFGIFFCHTFVLRCVTFVLSRIGVMEVFYLPFIQILQFFFTLLFSIFGIYIVQHLDVKRRICPYIGF